MHASQRLRLNQIQALEIDGALLSSHDDKVWALTVHLRSLLGDAVPTDPLDVATLYTGAPRVDQECLVAPFTEAEAKATIRAMNRNSSPGLDGFGLGFYAAAWPTVAEAVMNFISEFYQGTTDLERLNCSYIVMLPKHGVAQRPGDYKPICLRNCSMTIAAKMPTTRLQPEIQSWSMWIKQASFEVAPYPKTSSM